MPNQEPLVRPVPSKGAMLNKLKEIVPDVGEFHETAEELENRGAEPQDASVEAPEAPESAQAGVEAPEAPPPVKTAPEVPIEPTPPEAPPTAVGTAPVEEWEDFEVADDDDGSKYTLRAKKGQLDKVKNGYARKSAMSRATGYLSKYKRILEPIITAGRFDDPAAMIELGERDPDFRNAMYELYYRRQLGKPLQFADQAAQPVAPAPFPAQAEAVSEDDPLGLKTLVSSAVGPLNDELAKIRAAQDAQVQAQQNYQRIQQAYAQAEAQTVNEFTNRFPAEFTGNLQQDMPKFTQVLNYAKNAGLFERYGATNNPQLYPLVMVTAKLEMDRNEMYNAPSSAALSAADAAEVAERQAREASAQLAAAQGGGNASQPASKPQARQKPPLVDAKGKKLNLKQIAQYYEQPVNAG